ncbi:MAG: Crp/Fnr family transcriptional regulator [Myxococcota bacterium]
MADATLADAELLRLASAHGLLGILEPAVLDGVIKRSKVVRFRPQRTFLKSGDPSEYVYLLLEGSVRVFYRSEREDEILIKLFRAPALLCEMEVLTEIPIMPNARTLEDSTVLFVPAEVFRHLTKTHPRFLRLLIDDLVTRLMVASDQQRALAFADADRRVANALLDYTQLSSEATEEGLRINHALSQEQLAHDLGISRRAVNDALQKLKDEGVLDKANARYVVKDMKALVQRSSRRLALTHRLGAAIQEIEIARPAAGVDSATPEG